ncbi:MAG: hypothetical protein VKI82_13455 [Leptolyngbya sp.]|nr:hypothetical protein [Leptolyngbya sp.]
MDKIKEQASVVSQLVFAGETGEIYKKMLSRTWDILRETGILLWLVICLTFVGGEWFYRNSVSLGRSARTWYTSLSTKSAEAEPPSMEATGEALLSSVKSGAAYLLSQARQQLGLPDPEPTAPIVQSTPVAPAAPPAPVAPAAPPAPVVPPSAPVSNPAPTPPAASVEED